VKGARMTLERRLHNDYAYDWLHTVHEYVRSNWVKVGPGLLVVGAGPLCFIIAAAAVGLWPDPNPNPIGPGLLLALTFWPAVVCILVGVIRVRERRTTNALPQVNPPKR
jgi:hypothetical protein